MKFQISETQNTLNKQKNYHETAAVEMNAQKDKHLYNPPIQSTAGIPGAPIILIPLFCERMKSFMAESPKSARHTCDGFGASYE